MAAINAAGATFVNVLAIKSKWREFLKWKILL
jgi:hypothetical protein